MKIEVREITPDNAREILHRNFVKNRNIRKSVVDKYADDMKNGRWFEDIASPIVISDTGELLDGQHRLTAVTVANRPIKFVVQYDCPENGFYYIDNNAPRTAADVAGVKYSAKKCALAKMIIATREGNAPLASALQGKITYEGSRGGLFVSRIRIVGEVLANDKEYERIVLMGDPLCKATHNTMPTLFNYFVWLVEWTGRDERLKEFITDYSSTQPCSTCFVLRDNLLYNKEKAKKNQPTQLAYMLYAYEKYRLNQTVQKFTQPKKTFEFYESLVNHKREYGEVE